MNHTAQQYQAASLALSAVLDAAPASAWDQPSPCEGWTTAEVVQHLISTQRDFLAQHGHVLGTPADSATDPAMAWREHVAGVAEVLSDDAVPAQPFDGYFGPTTVGASFEQFYVWDMLVHRWDLARATGSHATLTEDDLDRIEAGADSFGDALNSDGVCGPPVPVAPDADRQTRLLGRLGRDVQDPISAR